MSRAEPNSLERSLAAVTLGVHQDQQFRKRVLADMRTGEYEQQVQLQINGQAGTVWAYVDCDVQWELPFVYAPAQRRVPFDRPHFGHSFELIDPPDLVIHLGAQVIRWNIVDAGWFLGATVRVHAVAPDATDQTPFAAIAHLTFEGYATPTEGDELS